MSLWEMSLTGSVLILVILTLRALTLHRLPKTTFLALWGVAAVRLLVPYTLPSPFSVYSLALRPHAPAVPVSVTENLLPAPGTAPLPGGTPVSPIGPTVPSGPDLPSLLWLAGMLVCGGFFLLTYLRYRRLFRESLPVQREDISRWLADHPLLRTVSVRRSDRVSTPLTYGILHPVILLPDAACREDWNTLCCILAHEYTHIRLLDAAIKPVFIAAACVHWFNPLVWGMFTLVNRDIELRCDEAVLRLFGSRHRSFYATALLRMEAARSGLLPLFSSFSKNHMEERIIAIMKPKKTSRTALLLGAALVVSITTAFATSGETPEQRDMALNAGTVFKDQSMMSYTDPDGVTHYSTDGGKTFTPMTDAEFEAAYPTPKVVWWTYEDYAAWLEEEKIALQDMIGEKGWTGGRGEFIWDQAMVDETIALYESILEDIKNGVLVSRSVDGSEDTMLAMGWEGPLSTRESPATAADFKDYEPYGLTFDETSKTLSYNGKRVRYFFDGAEVEPGGYAIRLEYTDPEKKGDIDLHTVRQRVDNKDGSYDLMGPLTGLEPYSQAEFDARQFLPAFLQAVIVMEEDKAAGDTVSQSGPAVQAEATGSAASDSAPTGRTLAQIFASYEVYGLTYKEAVTGNGAERNLFYNGQPVRSFGDVSPSGSAFSFTSTDPEGIQVRTVYSESGELVGIEPVAA